MAIAEDLKLAVLSANLVPEGALGAVDRGLKSYATAYLSLDKFATTSEIEFKRLALRIAITILNTDHFLDGVSIRFVSEFGGNRSAQRNVTVTRDDFHKYRLLGLDATALMIPVSLTTSALEEIIAASKILSPQSKYWVKSHDFIFPQEIRTVSIGDELAHVEKELKLIALDVSKLLMSKDPTITYIQTAFQPLSLKVDIRRVEIETLNQGMVSQEELIELLEVLPLHQLM